MSDSATIAKTQRAAVVAKSGGTVEIKEVPVIQQEDLAPGECLVCFFLFLDFYFLAQNISQVKLDCTGVCHTDLHAALGDWPLKAKSPLIGL